MEPEYMTKAELVHELNKVNRLNERLKSQLELFHKGEFLSRNTRKAIALLLSDRNESRADFDVQTLESSNLLDTYTYFDEFGMKLCLRTTQAKTTQKTK